MDEPVKKMEEKQLQQYIRGMVAGLHLASRCTVEDMMNIILSLRDAESERRQKMILGAILSGCTEWQQRNGISQATAVSVKIHEAMLGERK